MILQAALGASKVLLILGAGVAGSILVQNGNLSDFVNDTYKVLMKHLKHDSGPKQQSSVDPNLLAQLSKLKQELSSLSAQRSSVTIVSGSSRPSSIVISIGVPALVIGTAGYGYMCLRGLSLSDLMYVTKHSMSEAVSAVSRQLEQVTSALSATKRQLNSRIDTLTSNLDENVELQRELKDEVGSLRGDIARYGLEIETVQRIVQSLGVKIDSIESKQVFFSFSLKSEVVWRAMMELCGYADDCEYTWQDLANTGVIYLCNFVEGWQTSQQPAALQVFLRRHLFEHLIELNP
ncbi:hypothetical protein KP509_11G010300 [Ceratopteris richardii]|uniref:DUF1664 domain-containing protein n=1 Tax=Ceratopteris richardii TaxID=49495 RepID=A0A8T2TVC8_CERRI|nr:hypothetical protein KP509_11G010300 [Ceratopteris richardii]